MDFKGQELVDKLVNYLMLTALLGAFLWGYFTQNYSHMLLIFQTGVVFAAVLVVPDWPYFNQKPLRFLDELPSKVIEVTQREEYVPWFTWNFQPEPKFRPWLVPAEEVQGKLDEEEEEMGGAEPVQG